MIILSTLLTVTYKQEDEKPSTIKVLYTQQGCPITLQVHTSGLGGKYRCGKYSQAFPIWDISTGQNYWEIKWLNTFFLSFFIPAVKFILKDSQSDTHNEHVRLTHSLMYEVSHTYCWPTVKPTVMQEPNVNFHKSNLFINVNDARVGSAVTAVWLVMVPSNLLVEMSVWMLSHIPETDLIRNIDLSLTVGHNRSGCNNSTSLFYIYSDPPSQVWKPHVVPCTSKLKSHRLWHTVKREIPLTSSHKWSWNIYTGVFHLITVFTNICQHFPLFPNIPCLLRKYLYFPQNIQPWYMISSKMN